MATAEFSKFAGILSAALSQHHLLGFEICQLEFHHWPHYFMINRWGNSGNSDRLYFLVLQKSLQMVTAAKKLKDACSLEEKL